MHIRSSRHALLVALTFAAALAASVAYAAPAADPSQVDPFPSSLEPLPPPTASATPVPAPTVRPAATPSVVGSAPQTSGAPPAAAAPAAKKDSAPATLFDSNMDFAIGGFGGVAVMYSRVAHTDGVQVCGEGAVIIDHALTFGAGGCGFATPVSGTRYTGGPDDVLQFGYGGAIIRYHFFSHRVVNLGVGALIGAGGVVIGSQLDAAGNKSKDPNDFKEKSTEAVFVVEPQIGAYVNFTRWSRGALLAGYRYASGVETKNMSWTDISGPTLGGALQFGWF